MPTFYKRQQPAFSTICFIWFASFSSGTMKSTWNFGFLVAILIWIGANACTRDELEMVQIISVHGSMSPKHTYPKDPNSASVWVEGLNELTMLGKFQSYALGVFLKNFYADFITSDPREVEVISSAEKGIAKSAQSLVTALYSPTPYWEVIANFSWQPIYVKYDTEEQQYLSDRICPAADVEHKRILTGETGPLLQTYQNLLYYWAIHSGNNIKTLVDVEELYHILQVEASYNLTIPEWSKNYWNEMKYLHDVSISLRTKSRMLKKLRGGPLVDYTLKKMKEKATNTMEQTKVILYSTHIVPTMGFLAAIGAGYVERPPPCATVLVELYKKEGESFVRYLYLNSTMPQREPQEVYSITVPGCTEFCSLNYIMEYTKHVIPKNWEQECIAN